MPAYVGSIAVLQWVQAAATTTYNTDFRSITYAPSVALVDETAGADANKLYLAAQKDGKLDFKGVYQSTGTTNWFAANEGNVGTLLFSPEGTAAGKQKFTIPAISMGGNLNVPYDGVVELSISWQQNGARTEGTN
jgi:hypothetical protein